MQAVLLAGGAGKRVFPLSTNTPKPMFKILGKPLILHVIENLKQAGLRDFLVVCGPNGAKIQKFLSDGAEFGVNIKYCFQKDPLGMANALESAADQLEDKFFVVNADDIFESHLVEDMIAVFKKSDAEILLSCKPVEETWKFGIIEKDRDKVTRLVEKPPKGSEKSNLAVIGVYLLTKEILRYYARVGVSDHQYEDAIQAFITDGHTVKSVSYDGFFAGYKYPWDLFSINQHLMTKLITEKVIEDDAQISDRAEIQGKVWICKGAKILGGACLNGPVYVGQNSVIGNNALIRNFSSIGSNCTVGFSSEVKRSIVGDNCLFHMNFVGDSIISDNCLFGAGAITANFRFDEKNIRVNVDAKKVDSGTNKLGTVVGENSKVGVNATLAPGTKVGPNSIVGSGVILQSDLAPGMAVFSESGTLKVRPNKLAFKEK